MHTAQGGSSACPDTGRERRLAAQLADMIPGAATLRVSLTDPTQIWPHPHVVAKDAVGTAGGAEADDGEGRGALDPACLA